jgi:hypothetical protein
VTDYAGGYTPCPTPPPAAPKRACPYCPAGHRDLKPAAYCASSANALTPPSFNSIVLVLVLS